MKRGRFTELARAELLAEVAGILIHAIAHNRRRPTYWIQRLAEEG